MCNPTCPRRRNASHASIRQFLHTHHSFVPSNSRGNIHHKRLPQLNPGKRDALHLFKLSGFHDIPSATVKKRLRSLRCPINPLQHIWERISHSIKTSFLQCQRKSLTPGTRQRWIPLQDYKAVVLKHSQQCVSQR